MSAQIGSTAPLALLRGKFGQAAIAVVLGSALAGCGFIGAEITVQARNDSDFDMLVQVVDASGAPHGPAHRLFPLEVRELELAVPAGSWAVTVNGARLVESAEAAGRTGQLPVTLVAPAPDDPAQGPYEVWGTSEPGS